MNKNYYFYVGNFLISCVGIALILGRVIFAKIKSSGKVVLGFKLITISIALFIDLIIQTTCIITPSITMSIFSIGFLYSLFVILTDMTFVYISDNSIIGFIHYYEPSDIELVMINEDKSVKNMNLEIILKNGNSHTFKCRRNRQLVSDLDKLPIVMEFNLFNGLDAN